MNWQENIITNTAGIQKLLDETQTIAVLGIKTEAQAGQPASYVPNYLQSAGFQIIPVPVYYPEVRRIFWQKCLRQYGSSLEFATIPWPKRSQKRESRSFRTAASWWIIAI